METKGVTCKIPLELHQQASEEMQGKGLTVSQYIEMVIQEHMNGGINMANNRTLAFQVNDELFQNIKAYLARYEEVYHKKAHTTGVCSRADSAGLGGSRGKIRFHPISPGRPLVRRRRTNPRGRLTLPCEPNAAHF